MKKEIKAWAWVDEKDGQIVELFKENPGFTVYDRATIKLTGSYEVPEQTVTISESEAVAALRKFYYNTGSSFMEDRELLFKKALGFKV